MALPDDNVFEPSIEQQKALSKVQCETFTVTFDRRDGARLGLKVQARDACLLVEHVGGGLAEAWNDADPHTRVGSGDEIVEINGAGGSGAMLLRKCQQCKLLTLKIRKAPSARGATVRCDKQALQTMWAQDTKRGFLSVASQSTVDTNITDDFQWTGLFDEESSESADDELPATGIPPRTTTFNFTTTGSLLGFRQSCKQPDTALSLDLAASETRVGFRELLKVSRKKSLGASQPNGGNSSGDADVEIGSAAAEQTATSSEKSHISKIPRKPKDGFATTGNRLGFRRRCLLQP